MKKRIIALLVAVMVMAMGTLTVSAAVSPSARATTALADAVESKDGTAYVLDSNDVTKAMDFVEDVISSLVDTIEIGTPQGAPAGSDSALKGIIDDVMPAPQDGAKTEIVPELKAAFDFEPNDTIARQIAQNGGALVEFACDVKAGDNVLVLHSNVGDWEVIIPESVEDGKVKAFFTTFSPVAIVELSAKTVATASPRTGEIVTLLGAAAVLCLAGVSFCGRKTKENK